MELGFEVLLIGNDTGTDTVSQELGCRHIANVRSSENNVPFVSALFQTARQSTSSRWLCYLNADIILDNHFHQAINFLNEYFSRSEQILLTAQRKTAPIKLSLEQTTEHVVEQVSDYGTWDAADAIDMFCFNRNLYTEIPDFEIGRMAWDNWLVSKAIDSGAKIIDGTKVFHLAHPLHGYRQGISQIITGGDAQRNRSLVSSNSSAFAARGNLLSQTHKLVISDDNIQIKNVHQKNIEIENSTIDSLVRSFNYWLETPRSEPEQLDVARLLLWRCHYYFPFFTELENGISEGLSEISTLQGLRSLIAIQSLCCQPLRYLLDKCRVDQRELMIWGTGEMAKRLSDYLQTINCSIANHIDNDKDAQAKQPNCLSPEQLLEQERKPFIIIASVFALEIANQLESLGYVLKKDYYY